MPNPYDHSKSNLYWTEPVNNGNLSLADNISSPKDSKIYVLYKTEYAYNWKKNW